MSSHSLARSTGMTDAAAEKFMADYFRRFSGVRRWLEATKRQMMRDHFVGTLYGRRRPFDEMRGRSGGEVRRAAREPKDDQSGNEVVYWQRHITK